MSAITAAATTYNPGISTNAGGAASSSSTTLGENDFLNLLTTQLQNQDPSSPMDDTQFISEMAQFSSLQEMTALNSTMTTNASISQTSSAAAMIGHTVQTSATDSSGKPISGAVSSVSISNGSIMLNIGTNSVNMSSVTAISS